MPFVQTETERYRILTGTAGVNEGVDTSLFDLAPGKTLRIVGAFALYAPATGVGIGRAGVGSSAVSVVKPTGTADWTVNDLRGKYLRVVAGGGAPTDAANGEQILRPILSNNTTTISVNPVSGMDATTRFQIVTLATQVDQISSADKIGIKLASCFIPVEIYGLDFTNVNALDSLISATDSSSLFIEGCNIGYNTANPAFDVRRCNEVDINHCVMTGSGDIYAQACFSFQSVGLDARAGGVVSVQDCLYASVTKYTSDSAPSRVLSMVRVLTGLAEVTANNGAATPIALESVSSFTATGSAFLTGTGNVGTACYGVEIDKSGQYTLTGSTIAGDDGDVLFMNNAVTWANLSGGTYGIAEEHAGNALANSSYSKALKYGNYTFLGTCEFSSRVLYYGVNNPSQITGLTALGATSGTAYQMLQQAFYRFDTVAAGTGARLIAAAVVALPGVVLMVYNNGANALNVYPPSGGQIDAAGADVPFVLAVGAIKQFVAVSDDCLLWKSI